MLLATKIFTTSLKMCVSNIRNFCKCNNFLFYLIFVRFIFDEFAVLNKFFYNFANQIINRMSVTDILTTTHETLFSFEVLPPLRGKNTEQIHTTVERLLPFHPAFIEVTTHRSDFSYIEEPDGHYRRIEERLRPGTVAVAYALHQRYGLPVVPHLICAGYTQQETENELLDLAFLDLKDLLVLRGDKARGDNKFIPKGDGHRHADGLIQQVNAFNGGQLLTGTRHELTQDRPFTFGVAGYPEKHDEAMNLATDLEALRHKVELGAGYIVTQMFFDNARYFDFVRRCREAGIHVPIVPGLKPLSTLGQLTMLPHTFHLDFPEALAHDLARCTTNEEVREVGTAWCLQQCRELRAHDVPSLHFYTMNVSAQLVAVMQAL